MRIFTNIFHHAYDLISANILLAALAIAPVLGWLEKFVLGELEFVVTALLGVAFSTIVAIYTALRTRAKVWPAIEIGLVKAAIYFFVLILTHRMAKHHVSPAVDMITQHSDWLLYATIMMVELRQIKINAARLGVHLPELPFKKLNDLINKNDDGQR